MARIEGRVIKDLQSPRSGRLTLTIACFVLAVLAVLIHFDSKSLSEQRTNCEECLMREDDLAELFSGPQMTSFSEFTNKKSVEKNSTAPNREQSALQSDRRDVNTGAFSFGGGSFSMVILKDLSHPNEETDRRLGLTLHSTEWSSLFFHVLGCPLAEPYVVGEDIDLWTENRKTSFERAIPEFPMLARLWDPFRNVWYSPDEIPALKVECQAIKQRYSNTPLSSDGLRKLEAASDEALKVGLGLYLVAD